MSPRQLALFGAGQVAQARKNDPRSAKDAAARDRAGRANQRRVILEVLARGEATADDLAPVIGRHRSVASSRLAVLGKLGHAEKCGLSPRPDEYGHRIRDVELHRITDAGRAWLEEIHRTEAA